MKKIFIIANWKSNKTIKETEAWLTQISDFKSQISDIEGKEIVICPSFTILSILKSLIINHRSNIKLGAQDISPFDEGAYTGAVNGKQIKELADYVIIGHSERRRNFKEDNEIIKNKLKISLQHVLVPILCISEINQILNLKSYILNQQVIVAYEPLFAIGSGNPDTPKNADNAAIEIKRELDNVSVLYGGSIMSNNVKRFTSMQNIDGVLVGGASLDAKEFYSIIKNA